MEFIGLPWSHLNLNDIFESSVSATSFSILS